MIHATCHTDVLVYDVAFYATPWFHQSTEAQLLAFAAIDWGAEEPTPAVATHISSVVPLATGQEPQAGSGELLRGEREATAEVPPRTRPK